MARADIVTKLPLDVYAQILGIHPLHFNQITTLNPDTQTTVCAGTWLQHAWQDADRIGREELAQAIQDAERDIEEFLHARLMPTWEIDEWRPTLRPNDKNLVNLSVADIRGFRQSVEMGWKHFITGGIQAKEVIQAGSAIVYTDPDGDGYSELATVTATPVTITDPCEIYAYYPGHAGEDAWEIRPINVTINAGPGTATITFRRELALLEAAQESFNPTDQDGLVDANFLATVDVYRKSNDPQQQVQFLWEPFAGFCTDCSGAGCPNCAYTVQNGCLLLRSDPRISTVLYGPATWNATTLEFDPAAWSIARQPEMVRVWYYAGLQDKGLTCRTRRMSPQWERMVAYFATSKLDRPFCACSNVDAIAEHWRQDLAIRGTQGLNHSVKKLDNPFGTTRGAMYVWDRIITTRDKVGEGVLV